MLQKFPLNDFEWIKDTSQFNEDFIKKYNEEIQKGYFLEVENYMNFIMIYHFYLKEWKSWKSWKACSYFTW